MVGVFNIVRRSGNSRSAVVVVVMIVLLELVGILNGSSSGISVIGVGKGIPVLVLSLV